MVLLVGMNKLIFYSVNETLLNNINDQMTLQKCRKQLSGSYYFDKGEGSPRRIITNLSSVSLKILDEKLHSLE